MGTKGGYHRRSVLPYNKKGRSLSKPGPRLRTDLQFASNPIDRFHSIVTYGVHWSYGTQSWDDVLVNDPTVINGIASGASLAATVRLGVRGYKTTVRYKAQVNTGFRYEIFYCKCHLSLPTSDGTIISTLNTGITEQIQVSTSATSVSPGVTVFDSPRFLHYFKVYKTRKGYVPSGKTLTVTMASPKAQSYIVGPVSKIYALPKTRVAMIRFYGDPTNDGSGVSGTEPNFSVSRGVIDVVYETDMQYTYLSAMGLFFTDSTGTFGSAEQNMVLPTSAVSVVSSHNWNSFVP